MDCEIQVSRTMHIMQLRLPVLLGAWRTTRDLHLDPDQPPVASYLGFPPLE